MYIDIKAIARNKWAQIGAIAVVFVILVFAASGCGSTTSSSTVSSHHSIAEKAACLVKYRQWEHTGGGARDLAAISSQLAPITSAIRSKDTTKLRALAVTLQDDTKTLQNNLPPNCVPGVDLALSRQLSDLGKAVMLGKANKLPQAEAALKASANDSHQLEMAVAAYIK